MKQINVFLGNIFLPLVWMALTGAFTFANFVLGFAISSLALWLISSPADVTFIVYIIRFFRFVGFFFFFVWELLLANLRVAHEVLTPGFQMRAAIIAIPLDAESDHLDAGHAESGCLPGSQNPLYPCHACARCGEISKGYQAAYGAARDGGF